MSAGSSKVDHKAGALRLLGWIGDPEAAYGAERDDPRTFPALVAALVHSNLAIAEGQERVAEEIKRLRHQREEERNPWP